MVTSNYHPWTPRLAREQKGRYGLARLEKKQSNYPRFLSVPSEGFMVISNQLDNEKTPLLTNKKRNHQRATTYLPGKYEISYQGNIAEGLCLSDADKDRLVRISAAFLLDYERSRPATLHGNIQQLTD